MNIRVADTAGFCPGVRKAVEQAERMLSESDGEEQLIMLGELVHNQLVVDELLSRGFVIKEKASECPIGSKVLVRAHGITLEEERQLLDRECVIFDQTCIWVKRIQDLAARSRESGKYFILAGMSGHPEVEGILSRAGDCGILLQTAEEAEKLELDTDVAVLCAQTTFSVEKFSEIKKILLRKIANLEIFDTICFTTVKRQSEAVELAKNSDIVLVLGNANSSNTSKLYHLCLENSCKTYLIQRPDQVPKILEGRDLRQSRIGITAGASTPERMIREVIHLMTENQTFSNEQESKEVLDQQKAEQEVKADTGEFEFPVAPADNTGNDEEATEATSTPETEIPVEEEQVTAENEDEADSEQEEDSEDPAEDDSDQEENAEFSFSDYIDGIPQLKRGAIIKGRIVRIDEEFVYVDVRDKSEGKVPIHEFSELTEEELEEAVNNHREVEVFVRNIKNSDMGKEIILSKAKVDFTKHKEAIQQAFEDKVPVTVKVTNVVKDGVIASYGSVDLYIHRTQLELNVVDDLEAYRGQTMEVLITQFDPNRKRLRVSGSRRSLLSRERKQKAKEIWDTIEVGKEYEGTVRNLTDFGAFVDIGGVDGLVHISELSWKRIKHPSEVVSVGDKLSVFVKDFDLDRHRISLGYRRPEHDPYYNIEERFPMGSIVRGIVVRMFAFGAFVEIAPGVDALCHISQISNYRLNRPEDVLQEGLEVDARVLEVSNEARKISISIKEVEPIDPENPEELQMQSRGRDEHRDRDRDDDRQSRPRRPRRDRREDEGDGLPTTYVDSGAGGSSLSSLADITIASEEGAEVLKSLGLAGEEEAEEVTEVVEEAEEQVEEAQESAELVVAETTDLTETVEEKAEEVAEAVDEEVNEDGDEAGEENPEE